VLGGETGLVYSAVAMGLCLLPSVVTMVAADWSFRQAPDLQLAIILGGTGVRMGFVLGVGLLLYYLVPFFAQPSFWIWLLIYYLLTLALEVVLVVRERSAAQKAGQTASMTPAPMSKNN
jgi:hypothetical protein